MDRISRDQMLVEMAYIASLRSTCVRLKVGAVLAVESRPISLGYNNPPSGLPHCGEHCDTSKSCNRTIHAEVNAIGWALRYGMDIVGSSLYTTHSPCPVCARLIVGSGITRVVYWQRFRSSEGLDLMETKGIEVLQCPGKNVQTANSATSQTIPASKV